MMGPAGRRKDLVPEIHRDNADQFIKFMRIT